MTHADRLTSTHLTVDIGGTKTACAIATSAGELLARREHPTPIADGPTVCLERIVAGLREVHDAVAHTLSSVPESVGVACGGPLDSRTGVVYSPPNLPGWDAVPVKAFLEGQLGLPVFVENDANAGALAEHRFGAGQGAENLVYLTLGTGIGGGIIADGRLYRGASGDAGEVGHTTILPDGPECLCGKRGCLEALVAGPAIGARARRMAGECLGTAMLDLAEGNVEGISSETALQAALQGDETALEVFRETGRYLGLGIANLVQVLNPEIVVVGTIAVAAGDILLGPTRDAARRHTWPRAWEALRIRPAKLGARVGDLAALCCALNAGE